MSFVIVPQEPFALERYGSVHPLTTGPTQSPIREMMSSLCFPMSAFVTWPQCSPLYEAWIKTDLFHISDALFNHLKNQLTDYSAALPSKAISVLVLERKCKTWCCVIGIKRSFDIFQMMPGRWLFGVSLHSEVYTGMIATADMEAKSIINIELPQWNGWVGWLPHTIVT